MSEVAKDLIDLIRSDDQYRFVRGPNKGRPLSFVGIPFKTELVHGKSTAIFRDGSKAEFYISHAPLEDWKQYMCDDCRNKKITWYGACPHPPQPCGQPVDPGHCEFLCTRDAGHTGEHSWELGAKIVEAHESESLEKIMEDIETGKKQIVTPSFAAEEKPESVYTGNSDVANMRQDQKDIHERSVYMPEPRSVHPEMTIAAYRSPRGKRPDGPFDPVYCVCRKGEPIYNYDRQTVGTGLRELLWLYDQLREFGRGRFTAFREACRIFSL